MRPRAVPALLALGLQMRDTASGASVATARRATRVDPAIALRLEP